MLDELLEEIQELKEYKTKYEYAEKDKKEMSDLLYKYMMSEYREKMYRDRAEKYRKEWCIHCKYHCDDDNCGIDLPVNILEPIRSDKNWIPGYVGCRYFKWS